MTTPLFSVSFNDYLPSGGGDARHNDGCLGPLQLIQLEWSFPTIVFGKCNPPVGPRLQSAVPEDGVVAGKQLIDALECGRRAQGRPAGENVREALQIQLSRDGGLSEDRLDFRTEQQAAVFQMIEKRPDAHAVTGQHERLLAAIPEGKGKLAVEPAQEFRP